MFAKSSRNMHLVALVVLVGGVWCAPAPNGSRQDPFKKISKSDGEMENQLDQLRQPKEPAQRRKENPETPVRPHQRVGSLKQFTGIQYSPADLAEYILRTGDEEGVALAVEELYKEGLIDKTEAIDYLHDVKEFMTYLQDITKEVSPGRSDLPYSIKLKRPSKVNHEILVNATSMPAEITSMSPSQTPSNNTGQESLEKKRDALNVLKELPSAEETTNLSILEKVIYQLSREMFAQSLAQGDAVALNSLISLMEFMENEVTRKKISPEMKNRIMVPVFYALVESLQNYSKLTSKEGDAALIAQMNKKN